MVAVQRVWVERRLLIDADAPAAKGTRAVDLRAGKKTLGTMSKGAVRLSEPRGCLGIAESFEDSLAASQMYSIPCWATCGSARMAKVWIPDSVSHLIVFADADAAGERAAEEVQRAHTNRQVSVVFPAPPHKDFCEQLAGVK